GFADAGHGHGDEADDEQDCRDDDGGQDQADRFHIGQSPSFADIGNQAIQRPADHRPERADGQQFADDFQLVRLQEGRHELQNDEGDNPAIDVADHREDDEQHTAAGFHVLLGGHFDTQTDLHREILQVTI